MIHLARVAEFVDEHIIDELMREFHKGNVETNGSCAAAASPPAAAVTESYALVDESVGGR